MKLCACFLAVFGLLAGTGCEAVENKVPQGKLEPGQAVDFIRRLVKIGKKMEVGESLKKVMKEMKDFDAHLHLNKRKDEHDHCQALSEGGSLDTNMTAALEAILEVEELAEGDLFNGISDVQKKLRLCEFGIHHKAVERLSSRANTKARFALNGFAFFLRDEVVGRFAGLNPINNTDIKVPQEDSSETVLLQSQAKKLPIGVPVVKEGVSQANIDWVGTAVSTQVQNQGNCGGCWAFSASECIAALNWIQNQEANGNQTFQLSAQQVISCDTQSSNQGCNGGNYMTVWQDSSSYAATTSITSSVAYPFTDGGSGQTSSCSTSNAQDGLVTAVTNQWVLGPLNTYPSNQVLYNQLVQNPMSIAIYASNDCFHFYDGGILSVDDCSSEMTSGGSCPLDHAVLLVGVENFGTSDMAFKIKNSWGPDWGDDGYVYFGNNFTLSDYNCYGLLGMNMQAAYPETTKQLRTESPSESNTENPSASSHVLPSVVLFAIATYYLG